MLLCSWRKSRRTLGMVSTINIPGWLPKPSPGGSMEERCRGWVPLGRRSARQPGPSSTPILTRDELEEEVRRVGLERQVAELVDDQQLRFGVVAEPVLQPPLGVRLGEGGDERRRLDEQRRVA